MSNFYLSRKKPGISKKRIPLEIEEFDFEKQKIECKKTKQIWQIIFIQRIFHYTRDESSTNVIDFYNVITLFSYLRSTKMLSRKILFYVLCQTISQSNNLQLLER